MKRLTPHRFRPLQPCSFLSAVAYFLREECNTEERDTDKVAPPTLFIRKDVAGNESGEHQNDSSSNKDKSFKDIDLIDQPALDRGGDRNHTQACHCKDHQAHRQRFNTDQKNVGIEEEEYRMMAVRIS